MIPESKKNANATTVLVVEDDTASMLLLERLLQQEGYGTIGVSRGGDVYPSAKERQPDLILLDVHLPDEPGSSVCKKLKNDAITADIPVLFISADNGVGSKIECFDAGGQDYITKPFESREILARIRTHVRLRRTQNLIAQMMTARIPEIARAQQALLPPGREQLPGAGFAAYWKQLSHAGGDFYDVIKIGEDIYDYITADVCGHDIGLALATAALKALFVQNCTMVQTPAEALSIINRVMKTILQSGQFVGISWIRINRKTQKAVMINAGQPPIIYVPASGGARMMEIDGDVVGAFEKVVFEQMEIDIRTDDRFILYSDGVVETDDRSSAGWNSGVMRLLALAARHRGTPLDRFIESVVPLLLDGRKPKDDCVIVGIDV